MTNSAWRDQKEAQDHCTSQGRSRRNALRDEGGGTKEWGVKETRKSSKAGQLSAHKRR